MFVVPGSRKLIPPFPNTFACTLFSTDRMSLTLRKLDVEQERVLRIKLCLSVLSKGEEDKSFFSFRVAAGDEAASRVC